MYTDADNNTPAVDLNFNIWTDADKGSVYIKFTGFEDEEQIKQFAEYISDHLPLLLFNSNTAH